jgi:choline kinase
MVESFIEGVEIDTPEDLLKAQKIWTSKWNTTQTAYEF